MALMMTSLSPLLTSSTTTTTTSSSVPSSAVAGLAVSHDGAHEVYEVHHMDNDNNNNCNDPWLGCTLWICDDQIAKETMHSSSNRLILSDVLEVDAASVASALSVGDEEEAEQSDEAEDSEHLASSYPTNRSIFGSYFHKTGVAHTVSTSASMIVHQSQPQPQPQHHQLFMNEHADADEEYHLSPRSVARPCHLLHSDSSKLPSSSASTSTSSMCQQQQQQQQRSTQLPCPSGSTLDTVAVATTEGQIYEHCLTNAETQDADTHVASPKPTESTTQSSSFHPYFDDNDSTTLNKDMCTWRPFQNTISSSSSQPSKLQHDGKPSWWNGYWNRYQTATASTATSAAGMSLKPPIPLWWKISSAPSFRQHAMRTDSFSGKFQSDTLLAKRCSEDLPSCLRRNGRYCGTNKRRHHQRQNHSVQFNSNIQVLQFVKPQEIHAAEGWSEWFQ